MLIGKFFSVRYGAFDRLHLPKKVRVLENIGHFLGVKTPDDKEMWLSSSVIAALFPISEEEFNGS